MARGSQQHTQLISSTLSLSLFLSFCEKFVSYSLQLCFGGHISPVARFNIKKTASSRGRLMKRARKLVLWHRHRVVLVMFSREKQTPGEREPRKEELCVLCCVVPWSRPSLPILCSVCARNFSRYDWLERAANYIQIRAPCISRQVVESQVIVIARAFVGDLCGAGRDEPHDFTTIVRSKQVRTLRLGTSPTSVLQANCSVASSWRESACAEHEKLPEMIADNW